MERIMIGLFGLFFCICVFADTNILPVSMTASTCTGKDVCSINPETLTSQNDKAATVSSPMMHVHLTAKYPTAEIRIPANATTGYTWQVKAYDSTLLEVKKVNYIVSSQLIGAGGQEIWRITAKPNAFSKPITTQVTFIYARSWEKDQEPADSKTIRVDIH